ncbi:MAG: c-type cytochrome [Alphaproteobacteria bacterium]|nr:c-type cytochrome [Alphaproteobacteria bacterium]
MAVALPALACIAVLVAWSGIYNVAASRGHFAVVEWFLAFGMRHSVATHAVGISVPRLDDAALVQLGAAHFDRGCAECHGSPASPADPIAQQMLPPPPGLAKSGSRWTEAELFWIVRNGIKYTGMPAWPAIERADEVWAVVAFLHVMPRLGRDGYAAIARRRVAGTPTAAEGCAACHGGGDEPPRSSLVPTLHAQPSKFLATALQDFAAGRRRSGIMQPVAAGLSLEAIDGVATYYSGLARPGRRPSGVATARAANGRKLAFEGLNEKGVPPCLACHGEQALPDYPRLAGQPARYLAARLQRWQQDVPARSPGEALMAPLARRLDATEIDDVAGYFEGLAGSGSQP